MFIVATLLGPVRIDADEHRVEGLHHVFRATTTVMGRPRVMVVRRLPVADVVTIAGGPATPADV
jgi:hypothetical protein